MKNLLIIALTAILFACTDDEPGDPGPVAAKSKPIVVTSNYPLYFFASEIAADTIDVRFPSIDGDPAMWVPAGDDVGMLQGADLLILNGAGYEAWLAFATLPQDRILDTTAGVKDILLPIEEATVHQHGPQGQHSHEGTAFTTWLDPSLAIEQARAIKLGLTGLLPDQAASFQANFAGLEQRLLELDRSLARAFSDLGDQPVIFSHPVYQYLQQRYGINGRNVHWEPKLEPDTGEWIDFGNLLREHSATLMIWEAPPMPAVREKLAAMGVNSVVFSPAGNLQGGIDYFAAMDQNLEQVIEFTNPLITERSN